VHLIGFIVRIYHDAQSFECQIKEAVQLCFRDRLGTW